MYANLAPRLGQTSFEALSVGSTDLRGGKINWGSLGSSISNAFRTTGRFISNAASKFANSRTFKDIQSGINDSGLVRNVAGLAGDTINSLVDLGRLKVDSELQRLRNSVLNTIPADQLAQILQNYQQTHDRVTIQEPEPLPLPAPVIQPRKRPLIEEVEDDVDVEPVPIVPVPAVPIQAVSPPPTPVYTVPTKRIRGTGNAEWQIHLNNMLGQGVRYTSSNQCY
ncbi:pVI protein [unidentified adenovirus]|nr:pVI protein [unidentified adenovirus]